jgi:hypothetical protein
MCRLCVRTDKAVCAIASSGPEWDILPPPAEFIRRDQTTGSPVTFESE